MKRSFGMKKVIEQILARHKKTLADLKDAEHLILSVERNEEQRITETHLELGGKGAGIMDLHLEYDGKYLYGNDCGRDVFSVGHYYSQNMDLMSDPFIRFVDEDYDWLAAFYQQHGIGRYGVLEHQDLYCLDGEWVIPPEIKRRWKDTQSFSKKWATNLKNQGFLRSTLYGGDGNRISFIDENGRCRTNDGKLCPRIQE